MNPVARRILAHYSTQHQPLDVESLESGGFSGAVILRVRTRAGDFCLRGWPKDDPQVGVETPMRRILGLHRLLRSVFESGVHQVAVPVPAESGVTLVRHRDRYWQLEPWMPGRADFRENPNNDRLRAAMTCLAAWHRAAAGFRPDDAERPWFSSQASAPSPAVLERLDMLQQWAAGRAGRLKHTLDRSDPTKFRDLGTEVVRLFEQIAPTLRIELETAATQPVSLQPCLRDIWHDHVLFTGDKVTGLIDPSACRTETVAADVARLLGSLIGDDRSCWETALNEYVKHRPLSPEELALVPVLDHSGVLLSALSWLQRRYLHGEQFDEEKRVVERLERFVDRLTHLSNRV